MRHPSLHYRGDWAPFLSSRGLRIIPAVIAILRYALVGLVSHEAAQDLLERLEAKSETAPPKK